MHLLNNYFIRIKVTTLRYLYFFEALLRYKLLNKNSVTYSNYGALNKHKLIRIDPSVYSNNQKTYVIHLHGMGDNIWTAFKDGISIYPDYFGVTLMVLQLQNSPWCTPSMLNDLHSIINEIRSINPQPKIILSGTSMGGCIVINSLKNSKIADHIHAAIVCSASTQLDKLLVTTSSERVKKALLISTDNSASHESTLMNQSLHYSIPDIKFPIVIIYSSLDNILPSEHILETANNLVKHGTPVKFIKMNRPKGHYRPTKKELLNGFEWINEIINL